MRAGRVIAWTVVVLVVAGALGAALVFVPPWLARSREQAAPPIQAAPPAATRHIKATLFYVSEDGLALVPVEREVVFGESVAEQARQLMIAQLQPAPAPLMSALPPGSALRSVFISERGEAYVDMSPEISTAHPGGGLNELLTVYSIVNLLTTNLAAVTAVQILVGGREADTLAGHVDLRRPLAKSALLVQQPGGPAPQPPGTTSAPAPPPQPTAGPQPPVR